LLLTVSALPYVEETDFKLFSDLLKEGVMGKGLAQQFDDLKSLQGFMLPSEVFLFQISRDNQDEREDLKISTVEAF
jgi:hypothetical protein